MDVYIIGLFLTMLLFGIVRTIEYKNRYFVLANIFKVRIPHFIKILPMLPLTIIAGIRYNVGYDYNKTYVNIFKMVASGNSDQAWGDLGYTMLNKLVTYFTDDYAGIFIVTAVIFCACVTGGIYQESKDWVFSAFLLVCAGYYFNFLNGMRQMLAIAVVMMSIKYVRQRDFRKYILVVAIACLFHLSTLVFIPVYFLYGVKLNNYQRATIVAAVFVGSKAVAFLVQKIIMYTKYSWYYTDNYISVREGYIATLMTLFIFLFVCFVSRDEDDNIFINMQMIAACVQALVGLIPQINRIGWYYSFTTIFLIPNVVNGIKSKKMAFFIKMCLYILYLAYFIYTVGVKNSNAVLPYNTIFDRW